MNRIQDALPGSQEDTRPIWMSNHQVERGDIVYGDKKYDYTVLKKVVNPALPGFLGVFNGHYLISEEVPEAFRIPQLLHEVIETTELAGQKGRCLAALQRELATISDEMRLTYIPYRRDFFERLLVFAEQTKRDEDSLTEIRAALAYLRML